MLDQSHDIENKIEAIILSVMNVQTAYAKALCVNRAAARGPATGRYPGGASPADEGLRNRCPPTARRHARRCRLPADPFRAFRESGMGEKLAAERQ